MSYQQLTEGQRYQISVLRTQSMSVSAMARAIGVHRSTLYRELRRNSQDGYQPDYAQQQARFRRTHARKARIPNCVLPFVELALSWRWSPEQISAIGKRIGLRVSHEWIYRYVAANKALGGQLYRYLRQGHKRIGKTRVAGAPPSTMRVRLRSFLSLSIAGGSFATGRLTLYFSSKELGYWSRWQSVRAVIIW